MPVGLFLLASAGHRDEPVYQEFLRLGEAERMIRAGGTWSWSMFFMLGSGLQGKTLGIVGLGKIGTATVCARCKTAFTLPAEGIVVEEAS